jgi:hypothetical protein
MPEASLMQASSSCLEIIAGAKERSPRCNWRGCVLCDLANVRQKYGMDMVGYGDFCNKPGVKTCDAYCCEEFNAWLPE